MDLILKHFLKCLLIYSYELSKTSSKKDPRQIYESEHQSSKRRPNFTGAEVEVLWQNVFYSTMALSSRLS